MRQLSSGIKNTFLINALRPAPAELRSLVSHLITDKIYWHNEGACKSYVSDDDITVISEQQNQELHLTFNKGNDSLFKAVIQKWPDNWHDEEIGRDKMKM